MQFNDINGQKIYKRELNSLLEYIMIYTNEGNTNLQQNAIVFYT